MPQYDYLCATCGGVQTLERSIHAEAVAPMCCSNLMDRIFHPTPVRFNTSGFYSTDH